jgi:phosphatidylglycerophosphatase GEP4
VHVFGPSHVLIVSNSAGTRDDPAQLQAESVSYHLRAPVLLHASLKPSYSCTAAALSALPGVAPHELIVVGDRIFTDVVLAHRLAHPRTFTARIAARLRLAPTQPGSSSGGTDTGPGASVRGGSEPTRVPLAVWTTGVWMRESMAMRWAEKWLVHLVERWAQGARERRNALEERFVKRVLDKEDNVEGPAGRAWFSWVKGALPKLG